MSRFAKDNSKVEELKVSVPVLSEWHSNGIDHLSETSDIDMLPISDDEEMRQEE